MNVRLSKEQKVRILNSEELYSIMQHVLLRENKIHRNQEHFWVVGLDNKNKILFLELIGLGTVNRVHANPPDVFRMAIYKLAVKVVLVHNHPSGSMELSDADINLTDHMLKVGKLIRIEVLDHLVISETEYVSFADKGIMEQLKNSDAYEVVERERAEMKAFQQKMEMERALKENSLDIAKKMKEKGYDIDEIKALTGLKKWDIKKL